MDKLHMFWKRVVNVLDPAGDWVALLPIRLLMAYEFGKAGMMKFNGNNWFSNVQDNFPFPFNVIPVRPVHAFLGLQPGHPYYRRHRRRPLA
jgi:uncharacterized membrane protein YphA (DoxX/SURF4 family)